MKSYWFIYFSVYYNDSQHGTTEIKGNGVFALDSKEFLPGTITRILTEFYIKALIEKMAPDKMIELYLNHVLEISEGGFKDFNQKESASVDTTYSINSRAFYVGAKASVEVRVSR